MPASLKCVVFYTSPSFRQAQSALIGQLTEYIVIGRTLQALVVNVTPLSVIASFSFRVSFISSSPKGEQSRVTDSNDARIRGRPIIGADIKHFTDYRYRPF